MVKKMKITFKNIGNALCINLEGRLDATNSGDTERQITSHLQSLEKTGDLLINLSTLDYISSAGLRVLLVITKNQKKNNAKLCLFSLNDNVMEIFKISGFDTIFNIANNETEAVAILND